MKSKSIAMAVAVILSLTGCATPYTLDEAGAEALLVSTPYLNEYSRPHDPKMVLADDGMGILENKCAEATKVDLLGKQATSLAYRGFDSKDRSRLELWRVSVWSFESESVALDLIEAVETALLSPDCTVEKVGTDGRATTTEAKPASIALTNAPSGVVFDVDVTTGSSGFPPYTLRTYLLQKGNIVVKLRTWQTNDGLSEALVRLDELAQAVSDQM